MAKRNTNFRERHVYMITRTMCMYFHTEYSSFWLNLHATILIMHTAYIILIILA